MKILSLFLVCALASIAIIYTPESEAFEGSIYQCFHRVDYVKDPVPYAFVNSREECPPAPYTSKGHSQSVFVPKNTPVDHHCDTVKVPGWL